MIRYERAYKEEPEKWQGISEKHLTEVLRQNFSDVISVIDRIDFGETIETSYAQYRVKGAAK
jgi:hypothetical protein